MLFGVFGVVIISSLPDPRVVHGHKYRVAGRPVFHDLNEGLKLLLCPEQHLIGVLLAHAPRLVAGFFFFLEERRYLQVAPCRLQADGRRTGHGLQGI